MVLLTVDFDGFFSFVPMDWHVVDLSGTFEVTSDISHYTKAKFLSEIGRTEAIQVRCTSKGIVRERERWEMPAETTVIVCTADAICPASATGFEVFFPAEKFAIFASSLPVTLRMDSSLKDDHTMMERSQDAEWFCRQVIDKPESLHNFLLAFGPRRLPAAHGLTNAYSFLTNGRLTKQQLLHCDESPSKATFVDDLKENIRNGEKMQFRVQLQTLTEAEAEFLDWDPLDQTKVWLRSFCPLMPFGLLTLHSIIDHGAANLYAENECAPGIEPILNPLQYPLLVCQSEQAINPAWYDIIGVEDNSLLPKVGCRRLQDPYWQPNLFWTSVLSDADRSRLAQRLANYISAASSSTQREMMAQLVLIDPGLSKLVEMTTRSSKMDSQVITAG
ncbi:hypothetical protein D918_08549 [Trichuris suis]|nr:hypothetical protein D918_08549 [Trichuris suis]